jgi:hypothetical protein
MPLHKELVYGSDQHGKIRDAVLARYRISRNKMSQRQQAWIEAEDLYLSYVPEKDEEQARKTKQKQGEITFSQIVIPYSYATLLAAHTYWSSVFLGRDPVIQFTARHGETHQKVQAVEAVMDYQVQVGRMMIPLYLWLLDTGKYGIGVLGHYWTEEIATISEIQDVPETLFGIKTGKLKRQLTSRQIRGYCGNRLFNVRPYDFYPDPRVSITNFQDGEFCARVVEVGWNALKKSSEDYFNLDVLKDRIRSGELVRVDGSPQIELPDSYLGRGYGYDGKTTDNVPVIEMVWDLIPEEWDLGESKYPEKWVISIAGDVIIGCRPQGMHHNQFPYSIQTYEMDGYSHTLRGMLEVISPLAKTLDWLMNSHMFNVRKSLNDQLVVDPSRIVMKDLLDGGPGRMIRLNPMAYGTDPRAAISQLPIVDVTRQNISDAQIIMDMIQRTVGVTDNIMGMVNSGGRKTATEVRTSTSFGMNRLKTFTEYNSSMAWSPLSQMMLQNTQQYYDEAKMFKIAGDLMRGDPTFLTVNPDDIMGFYDFVPVDGTMPIDRFAQANLWKEILMGLAQAPQIASQYDVGGIFSWMAQLAGLKNITQFKIAPDQAVQQMAQAGNIVPTGAIGPTGGPSGVNVANGAGGSPAVQTRSGLTM